MIIEPQFDVADSFSEGLAAIGIGNIETWWLYGHLKELNTKTDADKISYSADRFVSIACFQFD